MTLKTKHQYAERFEEEAPHDAECVGFTQQVGLALAVDDGDELENRDEIDDSIRRPIPAVGLLKPRMQHSVFSNTIHHAIRADDGCIHRSRKNQYANNHDE